jgi:hypothetical protein
MSRIPVTRPDSQQIKTGMSILQDPLHPKKPPGEPPPFKRPTLADLRSPDTPEPTPAPEYSRPKLGDLKEVQVDFTLNPTIAPDYVPHTVEEYRDLQAMQDTGERGGLGPSLDEAWEQKQRNRARIVEYAQKIAQENKSVIPKRVKPRSEARKGPSKRDKMKEYAGNIPKPKLQPRDRIPELGAKSRAESAPEVARYNMEAELHRHDHFVNRVESLLAIVREYL